MRTPVAMTTRYYCPTGKTYVEREVVVVCDDGTVWIHNTENGPPYRWKRISQAIPGTAEEPEE